MELGLLTISKSLPDFVCTCATSLFSNECWMKGNEYVAKDLFKFTLLWDYTQTLLRYESKA